ncbi:fec operon regulator FecR [compost metagenome]
MPLAVGAEAWTQGLLVAQRMPLGELLAELDRYRPGVLRCDPRITGLQVSGSFSIDQPDASLELITQVLPVRVQRVLGYWASVVPA